MEDWFTVLLVVEWWRVGGNVNDVIRKGKRNRHVEIEINEGEGTEEQRTGMKNARILKLTMARIIYVMITVPLVLTTLRRETLLKQRWEVMLQMFVEVQLRKDHIAIILLTSATIDLTRNIVTMKSSCR